MAGRLAGKFALVVGGGSGIGRATALVLAEEGAAVAVADLHADGAISTGAVIREGGGTALAYRLDVTDEAAWEQLAAALQREWERLDVVVNSAGVAGGTPVAEMTLAEWERILRVNLTGVFLGTRFAIRAMRARGEGSIINISSVAGVKAIPGASAYSVSKAGVCMLSRAAALECAQQGWQIRVNSVLPGGAKTAIWRALDTWDDMVAQSGSEDAVFDAMAQHVPLKRYAEPDEIARAVLYLASDDAAYVTGTDLVIDGGYSAA